MSAGTRFRHGRLVAVALVVAGLGLPPTPTDGQWTNRYPKLDGYRHHIYLEGYELPILANGPIDAAPAPGGGSLAFSARGWIWVLDLSTGVARRLTDGAGMDARPAWSPDGETLAFVRDDTRDTHIVIVDAESGAERATIDTPALDLDPAFGPDGAEILYSSGRTGTLDLWARDLETGTERRVTEAAGIELRPQPGRDGMVYLAKGPGQVPDRIVLHTDEASGPREVSLVQADIASMMRPALDPAGSVVAYGWPTQERGWELRLLHVDEPGPSILLESGGMPLTPAWSHDGRWVYYSESDDDERMRLWRVPRAGGGAETVRVTAWEWGVPTARVRVRTTLDGRPSGARLSVLDASGHPAVPDAGTSHFDGQNGRVFFHSPGVVELTVPAGTVTVAGVVGLATPEASATVDARPGGVTEVALDLESVWDARAAGLVSGEHHPHLNYGGPYDLAPSDLVVMMRAENLDVATPLLANLHNRFGHQDMWGWQTGSAPLVRFGQEVRSHFLGHLGLIETRELFWPWVWGPGYEVYGADDRENAEALRFARAQGGLAYYVHPLFVSDPFAEGGASAIPIELIADAVLGDLDALELVCLWSDELGTAEVWYRFLNLGIPIAASAGTDVMLDFFRTMAIGTTRVYADTGGELNWPAYIAALREGRSFVTNGPMVRLDVGGSAPGGVVQPGRVSFEVALASAAPVDRIEVLVNGAVVAGGEGLASAGRTTLSGTLDLPEGGWIAARALGGETVWPSMDSYPFGHTSPVWIGSRGSVDPAAARAAAAELGEALAVSRALLEAGYGEAEIPSLLARFDEARVRLAELVGGN
ncbi:MAG: CehA/McbA family metallohydrolase [Gemmatimonadota bacterium]|nr:CehA/McbA family metallohydrolase [Gemmatimonadota bacterium]